MPLGSTIARHAAAGRHTPFGYVLPRDFMYRGDFFNPMRDAFFFTASVGRPSSAATSAVGRLGNNRLSSFRSFLDQDPFIICLSFLAISSPFSCLSLPLDLSPIKIVVLGTSAIKHFSDRVQKIRHGHCDRTLRGRADMVTLIYASQRDGRAAGSTSSQDVWRVPTLSAKALRGVTQRAILVLQAHGSNWKGKVCRLRI